MEMSRIMSRARFAKSTVNARGSVKSAWLASCDRLAAPAFVGGMLNVRALCGGAVVAFRMGCVRFQRLFGVLFVCCAEKNSQIKVNVKVWF